MKSHPEYDFKLAQLDRKINNVEGRVERIRLDRRSDMFSPELVQIISLGKNLKEIKEKVDALEKYFNIEMKDIPAKKEYQCRKKK